jgi:glycosyltransferase involved in cell wall biosynthesis
VVSIVLVTYNRVERLKLSIKDILNQTFKEFELIICDDCSTDGTQAVCLEFAAADERIRYYRHARNLKMPENCNFGIRNSVYPFIAILHDGDRFKPNLIALWYKAISENDSVGFVFNAVGETDADDAIVRYIFDYENFSEGVINREHLLKQIYFRSWQFDSPVYGEVMVRKGLMVEKGFLNKKYGFYADVDFWMELLHTHDAYYCADTLITGPVKTVQPRLFEDDIIKYFLCLFDMQKHHRKKAYEGQPAKLVKEIPLVWAHGSLGLAFRLLLVVKNFSFGYFIRCSKLLRRNVLFSVIWMFFFVSYPFLYLILKLFTYAKQQRLRLKMISKF